MGYNRTAGYIGRVDVGASLGTIGKTRCDNRNTGGHYSQYDEKNKIFAGNLHII